MSDHSVNNEPHFNLISKSKYKAKVNFFEHVLKEVDAQNFNKQRQW